MPPKSPSNGSKTIKPSTLPKKEKGPQKEPKTSPGVHYVYRKDAFKKVKIA